MNLAIVLGVSEYEIPDNNLMACKNDTDLIALTLEKINRFEEILVIDKNEKSKDVKEKISSFIEKYKKIGSTVDEIFFYYTGHGKYSDDEYYYLLSDYNSSREKQTSLENTELDGWIRSLNPKLTIKVVDACYSGVQYVKQESALKELLNSKFEKINDCYFMYSSRITQTSIQDDKLSFFTRSFIDAIISYEGRPVRYKDIMDYISDEFSSHKNQTPYFVVQANNTEIFADINSELTSSLKENINKLIGKIAEVKKEDDSLIKLILKDAERYCSEKEMLKNIEDIRTYISKYSFKLKDLNEVYELNAEFLERHPSELGELKTIGKWIQDNGKNVFATLTYKQESYKETEKALISQQLNSSFRSIISPSPTYEEKEVTKYRQVVNGFKLTQEVPYNTIRIIAKSKYENVDWKAIYILFLFSKTDIYIFNSILRYKNINWKQREIDNVAKWKVSTIPSKSKKEIENTIQRILDNFENEILDNIKEKLGVES